MKAFQQLRFDNATLRKLPLEAPLADLMSTRPDQRPVEACFSRVALTPLKEPSVVALSADALQLLDIDIDHVKADPDAAQYLSGSKLIPGAEPAAHCYCGHQFGNFAGQLGDGAAMYFGEVINKKGERWELQIKGGGKTPFSRTADGRKVLRSSLREFLCSEAMHYLHVPTTRAASLCTSKDTVLRDVHYDGNAGHEPCAVVTRMAPTFIRFGSFEVTQPPTPSSPGGPSYKKPEIAEALLSFVREQFFDNKSPVDMFKEMVRSTAFLVSRWQGVGWCHGVLNTDNMSILGLTIDYGPYGFMDFFDEDYVCNGSDSGGRYTYAKQAKMCKWNLAKFIDSIVRIDATLEPALQEALSEYDRIYDAYHYNLMAQKLGLAVPEEDTATVPADVSQEVRKAVDDFFGVLSVTFGDFIGCFRALSGSTDREELLTTIAARCASPSQVADLQKVKIRNMSMQIPPSRLQEIMSVPYVRERILGAPQDDDTAQISFLRAEYQKLESLSLVVESMQAHAGMAPCVKRDHDIKVWAEWLDTYLKLDKVPNATAVMDAVNPVFILRQWILQDLITAAEAGDYAPLETILKRIRSPFTVDNDVDAKYTNAPGWASSIVVTCSS